jgi:hypothetical protein
MDILLLLHTIDGGCFSHLKYVLWPETEHLSRAYEAVRRLVESGYLFSKRLPPLGNKGSGEAWLWLTRKGREALGDRILPEELTEPARSAPPFDYAHAIAVRDIRIHLQLACRGLDQVEQLGWITERHHERHPIVIEDPATQAPIRLAPDGSFNLRFPNGLVQEFFLEWDNGTIHVGRMRPRIRGYEALIAKGPRRPVILFVVPSVKRRTELMAWVAEEAAWFDQSPIEVRDYFWTALGSEAVEATLLQPIWQMLNGRRVSLLDLGRRRSRS